MGTLIADIETDGFVPQRIWMIGLLDYETDIFESYVGEDRVPEAIMRMKDADLLIGHNLRGYDVFQIERLLEGLVKFDPDRIVDTLELARAVFPHFEKHGLESWGERLGFPKLEYKVFDRFEPQMVPYCERDCRLTRKLLDHLLDHAPPTLVKKLIGS